MKFAVDLTKDTFFYLIGMGFKSLVGLLMLPLYTLMLTPDDYGIINSLAISTSLLVTIFNLGLNVATRRYYFEYKETSKKSILLFNALILRLLAIMPVAALLFFANDFSILLFKSNRHFLNIIIAILTVFADLLITEQLVIFQVQRKIKLVNTLKILEVLLVVISGIYFVIIKEFEALGAQLATLVSILTILIISFTINIRLKTYIYKLDKSIIREIIKFGLPFMYTGILIWLLDSSDRYFLLHFKNLESIGQYAIGSTIAKPIFILNTAVQLSFTVLITKTYENESSSGKPQTKHYLSEMFSLYLLVACSVGLLISAFSKDIILIFTNKSFALAALLTPLLLYSLIFNQLSQFFEESLKLKKESKSIPIIYMVVALFNITTNAIIIPQYGVIGAVTTTLISNILLFSLLLYASNRKFKIKYNITKSVASVLFICFISLLAPAIETFGDIELHFLTKSFIAIIGIGYLFSSHRPTAMKGISYVKRFLFFRIK